MTCFDTHYLKLAEAQFWYAEMLEARREWLKHWLEHGINFQFPNVVIER